MYSQDKKHRMKPGARNFLIFFGLMAIIASAIAFDKWQKTHKNSAGISSSTTETTEIKSVPESTVILKMAGSSTIGDALAPALVKAFMLKNGYSDVEIVTSSKDEKSIVGTKDGKKDRIDIASKGTGKGFAALSSNEVDICMASSQAPAGSTYEEHPIGLDGIAIVVNKNSSMQNINYSEIKDVFSNSASKIYRMDENAGISKVFKEAVMGKTEIASNAQKFAKSGELISALSSDQNGIGFLSYTLMNNGNIRALPIAVQAGMPGIVPNSLTIQSEKYPLCRRLYLYTNKSNNQLTSKLVEFVESKDGQDIVNANGFVNLNINLNDNSINPIAMPNDPPEYTSLINSAKKITTEFRFETGSQHLDSRGVADILRLVNYMTTAENKGKKVVLVGFTDNVGDNRKNLELSKQRANVVSQVLDASGITVKTIMGFGSARPVRSNLTEEDRANNRRVEVWLIN